MERYSNSVWNSEVSWSANTFEDHGRWKFFAIGGDCECDCIAPLLGAARLHWNCSAVAEFKGSARRKLKSHRSFIHIEQPGEQKAIPLQKCDHEPMELDGLFFQLLWELLGQSCLSAKADGMVLFPSLVPTQ